MSKGAKKNKDKRKDYLELKWLLIAGVLGGIFIASLLHHLPKFLIIYYLVISFITYIAFAVDKRAARRGNWRTPEQTLHLLSLLGGWPGALLGQHYLRHKSQKLSFRVVLWLTIVVNCGALIWLASNQTLQRWFG